jgi:hypothetical protein
MKAIEFEETEDKNSSETDSILIQSLTSLDKIALGVSLGVLFGLAIFLATNFLLLKGGEEIGRNLILLGQYFEGFDISFTGSLVGLFYGFIFGFILGWLIAFLRNSIIWLYIAFLRFKGNMSTMNDFIDNP